MVFYAILSLCALALVAGVQARDKDPVGLTPTTEDADGVAQKPGYSPYAQRGFPTQVYWGDTHVHTDNSLDARGLYGGYALFVDGNRLVYEYNAYNEDRFQITSNAALPQGKVELKAVYKVNEDKTGTVTLFVSGEQVGQGPVNRTHPGQFSLSETFDVGEDTGTPVSKSYTRDNAFSGKLERVVVALPQKTVTAQ